MTGILVIQPQRVFKMNMSILTTVLEEFAPGLIILNEDKVIIFADKRAGEINRTDQIVGKSFNELYSEDIGTILASKNTVITDQAGDKYAVRAKEVEAGQEKFITVKFQTMVDFNDYIVKLHCLETIIDQINEGILVSDHKGRIVLYNKAQERLEGLKAKDIVGKYLWQAYEYNPKKSEHRKVFESEKPILNAYSAHAYPKGVPQYLSYNTYPIKKDNETIAVFTISRNETSLKNLLHETIELKRRLFSDSGISKEVQKSNGTQFTFVDIKSLDPSIKTLIKESQKIALIKNNLLVVGETGTGKELFVQSIHNYGPNKDAPFIALNCAAIPENLLESTLFGTVKGSYTGSVDQMGFFEAVKEGTLFLDEINSLPVTLQSKLLRAIEERVIRRVGGLKAIPIKCRLICASNEDPTKLIEENKLREDFFFRIAGAIILIPPLRERKKDIIYLMEIFLYKYNSAYEKNIKSITPQLKKTLMEYYWPGNVRELEHIIESIIIKAGEGQTEIGVEDLPYYFKKNVIKNSSKKYSKENHNTLPTILRNAEEKIIQESLARNNWNLTKTAEDLGIIRQSLYYRMKKLGVERK